MEKYSRGWRGAPAKGVGRVTGARVQIPLSPFGNLRGVKDISHKVIDDIQKDIKKVKKLFKKVLTKADRYDNLLKLSLETEQTKEPW